MLCQRCNKNEATVHYTKIINGEVEELHLCDECAMGSNEFEFDMPFSFNKLLTGLIDNIQKESFKEDIYEATCPFCGLTYTKFKEEGKFGCAHCYDTFRAKLIPLFRGVHGHTKHLGKTPNEAGKTISKQREIHRLKQRLEHLVHEEAFEEAAVLRGKIRELESNLDG